MTKTNWQLCQSLDGTWWYQDLMTGAKLPPGLKNICNFPEGFKTIKIPKIELSSIKNKEEKNGN
jgi:hypothetical protein